MCNDIECSQSLHRRHRSRSVSACRNLKRRQNVRRLISLKEEEICFQKRLKLTFPSASYILSTSSTRGLKGGGKEKKKTTWDYGRLAKAVSLVSERDATSKKDLWYAIAQQYSVNFVYVSEKLIDYVQFGGQIVGIYVNWCEIFVTPLMSQSLCIKYHQRRLKPRK